MEKKMADGNTTKAHYLEGISLKIDQEIPAGDLEPPD